MFPNLRLRALLAMKESMSPHTAPNLQSAAESRAAGNLAMVIQGFRLAKVAVWLVAHGHPEFPYPLALSSQLDRIRSLYFDPEAPGFE